MGKGENTGYMHNSKGEHFDTKTDDNGNVYAKSTGGLISGGSEWRSCGDEKAESRSNAREIAHDKIDHW